MMPKILVFTQPGCFSCELLKVYLEAHGMSYDERDISVDPAARLEMLEKLDSNTTPTLVGFSADQSGLRPVEPLILSQTRTTFSLIVLLPILLGPRGWQRIKLPRPDLIHCLVLGMFGVAASNYFYYVAIQKTNVATAIILQYTAPVW